MDQLLALALSDTTKNKQVTHGFQMKEILDNITAIPDEFFLRIKGVGDYVGSTDVAEYILLSWNDYNDGLFAVISRDISDLQCLSENHLQVTTLDSIVVKDGSVYDSVNSGVIYFAPGTELAVNWTVSVPDVGLEDHYFDPRLLCDTAVLRCPADLYPYGSLQHRYDVMSTLPQTCTTNGGYQEDEGINGWLQGDTVSCRYLHLNSAALRPTIHCAHISSISAKCSVEKCPSAVRAPDPTPLTPSFDATSSAWLRWIELFVLGFFTLQGFITYIWYRYERIQGEPLSPKPSTNGQLPEIEIADLDFSWTDKGCSGSNSGTILKSDYFTLGGARITALTAPSGAGK